MTARLRQELDVPADDVVAVLSDPWSYAAWVVGASQVRDVEGDWPKPGAAIHHSIGAWPLLVRDRTKVVESELPQGLELDVAVWYFGRGRVRFQVEALGADRCAVTMVEEMQEGLMAHLPDAVVDPMLQLRNKETLRRLEALAHGRRIRGDGPSGDAGAI